jgi:hypothetical protein
MSLINDGTRTAGYRVETMKDRPSTARKKICKPRIFLANEICPWCIDHLKEKIGCETGRGHEGLRSGGEVEDRSGTDAGQ